MNESMHDHDHDDRPLTPDQRAARDAVRALGVPGASDIFRARMRDAFVHGQIAEGERGSEAVSSGPAPVARVRSSRARRRSFVVPLAMAALLLLAVGLANRGGGWEITGVGLNATVIINGKEVPCEDLSPIEAALRADCHIAVPEGGRMELLNARNFLLELGGGVELTLPHTPGRWFARDVRSQVGGRGTLRVATAPGFSGATYRLQTSSTELTVTGTAFTVIHDEDSVCLCVLEGEVTATLPDGTNATIGAGRRVFVSPESGMIDHGPMLDEEREALVALRMRADALYAPR